MESEAVSDVECLSHLPMSTSGDPELEEQSRPRKYPSAKAAKGLAVLEKPVTCCGCIASSSIIAQINEKIDFGVVGDTDLTATIVSFKSQLPCAH